MIQGNNEGCIMISLNGPRDKIMIQVPINQVLITTTNNGKAPKINGTNKITHRAPKISGTNMITHRANPSTHNTCHKVNMNKVNLTTHKAPPHLPPPNQSTSHHLINNKPPLAAHPQHYL